MIISKDGTTVEGKEITDLVIAANDVTIKDSTVYGDYVNRGFRNRFENVNFSPVFPEAETKAEEEKPKPSDKKKS